jgi:hypothetical protein
MDEGTNPIPDILENIADLSKHDAIKAISHNFCILLSRPSRKNYSFLCAPGVRHRKATLLLQDRSGKRNDL